MEKCPINRENTRVLFNVIDRKHETLINNYLTPDGFGFENCAEIAFELAKLLIKEDREPHIMRIRELADVYGTPKVLTPKIFNGELRWNQHIICCCEGYVFDPLLPEPIKIEDYCMTVFGEEVKMTEIIRDWKTAKDCIISNG